MKRPLALGAFAVAVLSVATTIAVAALLGVIPGFPLLAYDSTGTLTYDAGSDIMAIDATPVAIRFAPGQPPRFVNPTGNPPDRFVSIRAEIDSSGTLVGGVPGDDLIIVGEVDADGNGSIDYDAILLTGEVTAFGFLDVFGAAPSSPVRPGRPGSTPGDSPSGGPSSSTVGPTDEYDFIFTVTGGTMSPLYIGQDIGVTVTSEGSSFSGDFTVNFGGGAKGNIGPTDADCALKVEVQACVVPPPTPLGDSCDGKVTQLTLIYTGEGCSATNHAQAPDKVSCDGDANDAEPVHILVTNVNGDKIYADVPSVPLEGVVIAAAANANANEFASATRVRIFDADENLIEDIEFHTSCSQPLDVGYQFGSMFVQGMITTNGGEVVFDPPTDDCVGEFQQSTGFSCDGHILTLDLRYLGGDCTQTSHNQDPDKVSCDGDAGATEPVRILVTNQNGDRVYADVLGVPIGGIVGAAAANANQGQFASTTRVRIYDTGGTLIQDIEFHTSCSQPLTLADQFGSIQIFGMSTDKGSAGSLGAEAIYTYTVCNNSTAKMTDILVQDDIFGDAFMVNTLPAGQCVSMMFTHIIDDAVTNVVTATGNLGPNLVCTDMATATIDVVIPPEIDDCCESGNKIVTLTCTYTGDDCSATSHSQDPNKVTCSGDPAFAPTVHIIANNKENPNDGKIFFDGDVDLDMQFVIDATAGDRDVLPSSTFVHIFDLAGNLLQTIKFHTSCSQPLAVGDQFGAVRVDACSLEGGPAEGQFCNGGAKPQVLVMQYTGQDCAATMHSQDAGKVECDGDPAFEGVVRIRASNKENPNDGGADVWHDAQVMLGASFAIDATLAGENKLASNTFVHIFDTSDILLQTIKFHTSCSQPLNQDDQFGAVKLLDFIPE